MTNNNLIPDNALIFKGLRRLKVFKKIIDNKIFDSKKMN